MRCVACGVEMRVVRALPDQSMMVSGKELRTLQCSRCDREEQQLVFTHVIEQLPALRMQLPGRSSASRRTGVRSLPNVAQALDRAWSRLRLFASGRLRAMHLPSASGHLTLRNWHRRFARHRAR
jgi:hypothetical protein